MGGCIFCKIAKKEIGSDMVYEDRGIIAFKDINPAAKVHVLIIPKEHIESTKDIKPADSRLLADILNAANKIAGKEGISETGFRILINSGPDAGQMISHLHFHLLGGEKLKGI